MTETWFVYDGDGGIEWFQSKAAAQKYLQDILARERMYAEADGEWDPDTERICMGIVTRGVTLRPDGDLVPNENDEMEASWDARIVSHLTSYDRKRRRAATLVANLRRRAANYVAYYRREMAARDALIIQITTGTIPLCFPDCIHAAECEHREPNLCGVAAPCRCWPFGPEGCKDCNEIGWHYPTEANPSAGYPGPARLRFTDLTEEQIGYWIDWHSRRVIREGGDDE